VKKLNKKERMMLLVLGVFAVMIIAADLVLFYTSLKEDGVGRGFSRYWSQQEP
jgi:flagellar biosynthesis/type III secretory pathway M-ring protein FliF/YscJ